MRNLKIIPFLFVCILMSCDKNFDQNSEATSSDQERIDYLAYVEQLEKEFPGKTIYHNYNPQELTEEIKTLLATSVEEVMDADMQPISTRSFNPQIIEFGPWGKEKGFDPFKAPLVSSPTDIQKRLYGVKVWHKDYINAVQLYWIDNNGLITHSSVFGTAKGNEGYVALGKGDAIIRARVKSGGYIDNLLLESKYNIWSFGGTGGTSTAEINFSSTGLQMHGMYGFAGTYVSQLGFYCYHESTFVGMNY